jgi:hypothetical protein
MVLTNRSIRPIVPAVANAVFDATSARLRRAPLTPDRLSRTGPELHYRAKRGMSR